MVRIDDGVFIISVDRVVLCVDYENEVKNTDCMGRKKVDQKIPFFKTHFRYISRSTGPRNQPSNFFATARDSLSFTSSLSKIG